MSDDTLKLFHLSDIHFKRHNTEINKDIQNELEIDAKNLADERGAVNGILITGDIAFSGQKEEYAIALDWLERLCSKINCPIESVWCIPGNHDVDRKVIEESLLIKNIHKALRGNPDDLDNTIEEYLQDAEARDLIYRSTSNYVLEFASKFKCDFSADKPYIEHNFTLNDGSILKLRGVNSALVSYKTDNNAENKLVVGGFQSTISREDGVEYLLMCHHPYQWLLDEDARRDHWQTRARIHLFGHKHNQRLDQINNSLIMTAGAMLPDNREPNWQPKYNFLEVHVNTGAERALNVNVYPRVWKVEDQKFLPDYVDSGKEYKEFNLAIDKWSGSQKKSIKDKIVSEMKVEAQAQVIDTKININSSPDPARRLTYRFLRLPYHKRIGIATQLDLLRDDDKGFQDSELFQRFFKRAKENNKLGDLWDAVEHAYNDNEVADNPYKE